jgi:large repetitive protein
MRKASESPGSGKVRKALSFLLASAGPILVVGLPAAVVAQSAINTARVTAPAALFEANTANNEVVDDDTLLAVLVASNDSAGPVNGANGGTNVLNVLANDTLNAAPASLSGVTLTITTPSSNPGISLDPATGNVSVAPGVPAGNYTITYQICETANPSNCATASLTVVVAAPEIAANDDTPVAVNGATGADDIINVFANDMLNGVAIEPSAVTATVSTPASSIGGGPVPVLDPATGLVDVPAGTPAGNYTIAYQICEINNPANCETATITVAIIAAPIAAANDAPAPVRSAIGNPNAVNVFGNDTINGVAATPETAIVTVVEPASNPGVALDPATGIISVIASVPAGTYSITYQICERLNPSNCAQAVATIVVEPAISALAGTVYTDANGNGRLDGGETRRAGWIVEVIRDGQVVATTTTDSQGDYRVEGLLSGGGYAIQFRNPENNVVYDRIEDVSLANNTTIVDQNLPIDPSGIIYDSVTRGAVRGAIATLVGSDGNPLPVACFMSATQQNQRTDSGGQYRFDIIPGAAPQCPTAETLYRIVVTPPTGYSAPSSVLAAQPGAFDPTGRPAPVLIAPSANPPAASEAARYFLSFRLASGDPDIIFNHIPIDPFLSRTPLVVTKTSIRRSASVGDLIPYTITVRNTEAAQRSGVDVVDILPPGFKYVPGSSTVDDRASEPQVADRELRWNGQIIPANGSAVYKITAVVGAGVSTGDRINNGLARNDLDGAEISNRGQAVVSIVPSAVFDCSELIGKVYDDLNGNGYQDEGEPGIPGAKVVTVNGELVTADQYGRYHITCAAVPDARIGSNYVLKLDLRTVPLGFAPTTDNPQSIRLTRGKISELNFGVQKAMVTEVDLDQRAFAGSGLNPQFAAALTKLKPAEARALVVRVTYRATAGETASQTEQRMEQLHAAISAQFAQDWKGPQPVIETNITRAHGQVGRE